MHNEDSHVSYTSVPGPVRSCLSFCSKPFNPDKERLLSPFLWTRKRRPIEVKFRQGWGGGRSLEHNIIAENMNSEITDLQSLQGLPSHLFL